MTCVVQEEESELEQVEHQLESDKASRARDLKDLEKRSNAIERCARMVFSPIFVKAFTLTFLAEWGDRSQIATIG